MQVVWSPDEDQALLDGLEQHGKQWKKIVRALPRRNVNQARNRFLRLQEGKNRIGKNRCQFCRETRNGHICLVKMMGQTTVDIANPIVVGEGPMATATTPVQPSLPPHASLPEDPWLEPHNPAQQASVDGALARALDDALQSPDGLPSKGLQTPFVVAEKEAGRAYPGEMSLPPVDGCAPLATDENGVGSCLPYLDGPKMAEPIQMEGLMPLLPPEIDRMNTQQLTMQLIDMCWPSDEDEDVPLSTAAGAPLATPPPLVLESSFEQALSEINA